jgi:hypothetical protein
MCQYFDGDNFCDYPGSCFLQSGKFWGGTLADPRRCGKQEEPILETESKDSTVQDLTFHGQIPNDSLGTSRLVF